VAGSCKYDDEPAGSGATQLIYVWEVSMVHMVNTLL
jgi:hypothetical protein